MSKFDSFKQAKFVELSVLLLSAILAFAIRLYSVIRYESIIHEFDPYFNYRTTKFMTTEGFLNFHDWFDDMAWYPLGRIIGGTIYPGLMITSSLIYYFLHILRVTIDIRNVCVFLAPLFSSFTTVATYLLTKEIKDSKSALIASALVSIVPGYISRSVAGSYDNEGIAIFCMLLTFYLWMKAVKTGSVIWSSLCSLAYFYMVSSWGGYVFLLNIIPIHVLVLIACGRFSHKIYVAYCTFYTLGTILSMQISFVGFNPLITSEHMGALGVFGICQLVAFYQFLSGKLPMDHLTRAVRFLSMCIVGILVIGVAILSLSGKIAPWTGRFYSLLDPTYAKNNIPIIASVSEHQPTSWASYYFDMQMLVVLFPVGLYYCFKQPTDTSIFLITCAVTSLYFSGVMVRLILVLAPIMCVVGGIGISGILSAFIANVDTEESSSSPTPTVSNHNSHSRSQTSASSGASKIVKTSTDTTYPFKHEIASFMIVMLLILMILFTRHCIWVTSNSYSHPTIVLESSRRSGERVIIDDYREAYFWLRQNTAPDARVMSWWDYGYQITGIANRTVLVDNNTWNNTHIGRVGQAMASSEPEAYEIMRELDVDYVLVIFGGLLGYSSDDINKFIWMVRIAGSTEQGRHVNEMDYYTPQGEMRVDTSASPAMSNCLLYKLSYYRFWEIQGRSDKPPGYDTVREQTIGNRNFKLHGVEEAFTTKNWLVRIYRVKPLANLGLL